MCARAPTIRGRGMRRSLQDTPGGYPHTSGTQRVRLRTCRVRSRGVVAGLAPPLGRAAAERAAQRAKLLEAMVRAVAEKGYAAATVADAVRLARVSRGTFYELFDSKEACLASAYRLGTEVLEERITEAVRERGRLARGAAARAPRLPADARRGPAVRARVPARVAGRRAEREAALRRFAPRYGKSFAPLGTARAARRRAVRARRRASMSSPARGCAPDDESSISRTSWWAAPCGSPPRRNHGPDVQRARARVPRRAARVARRQRPGRRAATATRTPTTPGGATSSAGSPTAAGPAVHWPREYGGRGATLTESAIFFEELGRSGAPLPANVLGLLLAGPTIMTWGTDGAEGALPRADPHRRGDLVPGLLRARRRLRSRGAEDARGPRRRRVGRHRSEGVDERRPVLEVVHARRAHRPRGAEAQGPDLLPDGHGAGRRRRSAPLRQITGEPEFNELFLDGARIPDENVLGGVGNGWKVALTTLMNERAGLGVLPAGAPAPAARPADRRRPRARGLLDDPVVADRLGELHLRAEIAAADRLPRADRDREVRPARAGGLADQVDVVGHQPAADPVRRRPARPEALRRARRGRTSCCARAATRSRAAPPRCSRTSSPSACSASPRRAEGDGHGLRSDRGPEGDQARRPRAARRALAVGQGARGGRGAATYDDALWARAGRARLAGHRRRRGARRPGARRGRARRPARGARLRRARPRRSSPPRAPPP